MGSFAVVLHANYVPLQCASSTALYTIYFVATAVLAVSLAIDQWQPRIA